MKKLLSICSCFMFGLSVNAAVFNFSATNLPSQLGQYNCSYFSTNNLNVAAMLTLTTNSGGLGPPDQGPTWDFSQLQQTNETVLRTGIISPANGMDGGSFPNAAYAEQDATETPASTNLTAWRYYSITSQGRLYYGSYVTNTSADGLAVFDPPTVDIPATVTNGQTWTRTTSWNSTIDGYFPISYTFSDTSTVDAQGTLILPNLGAFTALRVHEVHGYTGLEYGFFTVEIVTNQFYYWLVPGLGVAVQIGVYGNNIVDSETPPFTNSVERMFYASYFNKTNPPPSPRITGNLHIQLQSGSAFLAWTITNSTSYQIQANGSLNSTNWQVLGLTSKTNWTDALTATQRFYRVVGLH
jgi:hypothetical protein